MRIPVGALSSRTTDKNKGTAKRHARLHQKLREEHHDSPPLKAPSRSGQATLPSQESVNDKEPDDQQPHHRRQPHQVRPASRRAADQRPPQRHGYRACCSDEAVGRRTLLRREVGGDERNDRGHDERRADVFEERPTDQQDHEIRSERSRQRTSDARSPSRSRHDQGVERDRGLNAGDARADVLGDGRHRNIHDRACPGSSNWLLANTADYVAAFQSDREQFRKRPACTQRAGIPRGTQRRCMS
ncbi:unnamed protein product, partial [Mesorhabditis spiculigera]